MEYETVPLDLADRFKPTLPAGDDRDAASAVLNTILEQAAAWSDELFAIGNQYFDAAPESSTHVCELSGLISRAVLDWIERWPR